MYNLSYRTLAINVIIKDCKLTMIIFEFLGLVLKNN